MQWVETKEAESVRMSATFVLNSLLHVAMGNILNREKKRVYDMFRACMVRMYTYVRHGHESSAVTHQKSVRTRISLTERTSWKRKFLGFYINRQTKEKVNRQRYYRRIP